MLALFLVLHSDSVFYAYTFRLSLLTVRTAFFRHSFESCGVFPPGLGLVQDRVAEGKYGFGVSLEARVEGTPGTEWSRHLCTSVDLFLFPVYHSLTFQVAGKDLHYVSKW